MKRFDFRRELKDMTLEDLKLQREKYIEYMFSAIGNDDNDADRYSRYVNYIDIAIEKKKK